MKLFCVNLSWSYSPFKIPRKNHTSSVQNLSWTCAHYYSLPWNNLPCIAMPCGKLWGLWHLSRQRVTWKPVTKWFVFFFSVLDSWLPYFRSTTRKNYILFDFRFLRDVAATYYNSALLNRQDSCRPCAPTYRWMSFRYQFFFTDINVFSSWLWHSN